MTTLSVPTIRVGLCAAALEIVLIMRTVASPVATRILGEWLLVINRLWLSVIVASGRV
jgi:hypothetical protein